MSADLEHDLRNAFAGAFPGEGYPGAELAIEFLAAEIRLMRSVLTDPAATPLRPPGEIQYAHDVIVALLLNPTLREALEPANREALNAGCNVLCWVLRHNHNPKFERSLAALVRQLRSLGIVVTTESPTEPFHG